jgi:hypothetical protein
MSASVRAAGKELNIDTPRLLFELNVNCGSYELSCYDMLSDGSRILAPDAIGPPPPVILAQNLLATLKK